jgi:hypothetical protein
MVGLPRKPRIGMLCVTDHVIEALSGGDRHVALTLLGESIERFRNGDWGDVDAGDSRANDVEMESGGRILAVYRVRDIGREKQVKIYIVHHVPFAGEEQTEGPTTILLPEEY